MAHRGPVLGGWSCVEQLELAATLLEASVRHGVTTHLSIGYAQALTALDTAIRLLPAPPSDLTERVERLLEGLRHQAVDLAGRGGDIPAHEVSYEAAWGSPAAAPPEQCGRRAYQELCRRHPAQPQVLSRLHNRRREGG